MGGRQGDVLLVPDDREPTGAMIEAESDLAILAHGELTGHHHSVRAADVTAYGESGVVAWLKVHTPTEVRHQEHEPILLEPGTYMIIRQVEYSTDHIRRVAD